MLDAPPPDFRLLQFSSDETPNSEERFEFWRDIVTRKLLQLAIDRLTDEPFRADAGLRSQYGVTIGVGRIGPTVNHRTRDIVAADNDDFVLMANLEGPFLVRRDGSEITLDPGEATLVSCADVSRYIRPVEGRMMCARLPRGTLTRLIPDPDERTGRVIPSRSDPLRMLMAYVSPLWMRDLRLEPPLSKLVVDHICDLVALAVGARGEGAEVASRRGGRAAKLAAIKRAVEARIGPYDFSADDIAGEVGVSPRYVRKLFETEGLSFSRYVAERRLQRARGMLENPRFAGQTVSTIAFDVGFGDLSYFNRAFRRRFERTPSDLRAEAGQAR